MKIGAQSRQSKCMNFRIAGWGKIIALQQKGIHSWTGEGRRSSEFCSAETQLCNCTGFISHSNSLLTTAEVSIES